MKPASSIINRFIPDAIVTQCNPLGKGLIHETWLFHTSGGTSFVLQKINTHVFRDASTLMQNIMAITSHLKKQSIPTLQYYEDPKTKKVVYQDNEGNAWRLSQYIQHTTSPVAPLTSEVVYQGAVAFGTFQAGLQHFPTNNLKPLLIGFHHTPTRLKQLQKAWQQASPQKQKTTQALFSRLNKHQHLAQLLTDPLEKGRLPEMVTHNDTKIDNVLFCTRTGNAKCVIDLDTVMPGTRLYDIGDYVLNACRIGAEDEPDSSKVEFSLEHYKAAKNGFLDRVGTQLTALENELFDYSGAVICYELALRFLTDYLQGNPYFSVTHPEQNIHRTKVQLKVLEDMIKQLNLH